MIKKLALGALAALIATGAAAKPELLGVYKDWSAFTVSDEGPKTCFMFSEPKDKNPKNVKRGKVFLFVTHTKDGARKGEVNLQTGYPFKSESSVTAKIGSQKFTFFTENEDAWIADQKKEPDLITAMRKGSRLTMSGTSKRGTKTVDHYSLSGFTTDYQSISRACGVS